MWALVDSKSQSAARWERRGNTESGTGLCRVKGRPCCLFNLCTCSVPPGLYEEIQVAVVIHDAVRTLEIVVNVFVEGSTQTSGLAEVSTRCSESHAHSPVAHICSHKRPRRKHHLRERVASERFWEWNAHLFTINTSRVHHQCVPENTFVQSCSSSRLAPRQKPSALLTTESSKIFKTLAIYWSCIIIIQHY